MRFSVLKHKGLYGLVQCFPITMTCHPEGNVSEWVSQNKGIMSYLKSTASYRVFRKNCVFFFKIHCNPSLRAFQSSQRYASVQPLLLAGNFFLQIIATKCWRGRGGKLSRIFEKKTIFNEHPVLDNNRVKISKILTFKSLGSPSFLGNPVVYTIHKFQKRLLNTL